MLPILNDRTAGGGSLSEIWLGPQNFRSQTGAANTKMCVSAALQGEMQHGTSAGDFMKSFILFITVALAGTASGAAQDLYRQFQDPPHTYSIRPFWFWNGKLDAREIERQIDEMVSQGVYGAYVHNRTGLQTPYLSAEYFRVVGAAFEKAKKAGFLLNFVDEYEWPGGEARDVWLKGLPSRVIAANPEFRMRGLWYSSADVDGPGTARIDGIRQFQFAVAARLIGADALDGTSLTDISGAVSGAKLSWPVPAGRWRVMEFHLEDVQGRDAGLVDLMNADAIHTFISLVHEQYYKRFSRYFGTTIDSVYSDHEGDYGGRIAWTPALFGRFRDMKGYDLRKYLPLLLFDGGKITTKVRCDYLDVISELYSRSYFKQVADWAEAHRIKISGHQWEEFLQTEAGYDGDLQRNMSAWSWPGVDSLFDYGRKPRDFKVTGSVAHFRGTRFTCENQGLHGRESYFDLQKARLGTNTIAAWGVSLFIPHAFNYNSTRIEYPPDWFYHQPYWKYFKHYADYTRRLAFMNDGGRHFADILYFHPKETAWAYSDVRWPKKAGVASTNPLVAINETYAAIMNRLEAERWDFDMADSHYLDQARIADRRLHLGNESYRVLLLPPMTTIPRGALDKIREFYNRGGIVIAVAQLPGESVEEGRDDPRIAAGTRALFGDVSSGSTVSRSNAAGGKAFFIPKEIGDLVRVLEANLDQDVKLVAGSGDHLYALHRRKEDTDFYYLVNDSGEARDNTIVLSKAGVPERWDAETGKREPLESRGASEGTEVKLHFAPWDACYVVFSPQPLRVTAAPAAGAPPPPISLGGAWSFRPERNTVAAPYAMYRQEQGEAGESAGWHRQDYDDKAWTRQWLSRERLAVRDWWLVGPFPNQDHKGCIESLPPEADPDPRASYGGLSWKRLNAASYAIDLNRELGIPPSTDATAYALTYVYSPAARKVQFRIAANNNAHLLVNGKKLLDWHIHPYYYELREDFALTREAELHAGWNEVLVKVSRFARGPFGFYLRLTDERGAYLDDLTVSPEKRMPSAAASTATFAWYRIPVPPSSTGVQLPQGLQPVDAYLNGRKLAAAVHGLVRFAGPAQGSGSVLALKVAAAAPIRDTPRFQLGTGTLELGSWTAAGLPYYSGGAFYEKDFDLPREYAGRRLTLDCGTVGVAAEVRVNGRSAGSRVWQPFSFDISGLVRPGRNHVSILVTNTMANERAVENHADTLPKIDINGLHGPVRIVAGRPVDGLERASR
jgi:hypothetical protein